MNKFIVVCWLLGSAPFGFAQGVDATDPATIDPAVIDPAAAPAPTNALPAPTAALAVVLSGTNEVPANASSYGGSGIFTLSGNLLSYDVTLPFPCFAPIAGGIYGPAGSGTNGDIIFAWTNYATVLGDPNSAFRGAWEYKGTYPLTAEQVAQLNAGLWYVDIQSADFPDGELRGQIGLPAPDAASVASSGAPDALPAPLTASGAVAPKGPKPKSTPRGVVALPPSDPP